MHLGSNPEYQFYALNIHQCTPEEFDRVTKVCEQIEKELWNAVEDFHTYVRKQSFIFYAVRDGEIVGFGLFRVDLEEGRLIAGYSECMVLRKCRGSGLQNIFVALLILHIRKNNYLKKSERAFKSVLFLGTSGNYTIVRTLKIIDRMMAKSSFRPDADIIEAANYIISREQFDRLSSESPFFLKCAFPNAMKSKASSEPPAFLPADFVSSRGDAFLYLGKLTKNFWGLYFAIRWYFWKHRLEISDGVLPIKEMAQRREASPTELDFVHYAAKQRA